MSAIYCCPSCGADCDTYQTGVWCEDCEVLWPWHELAEEDD